MEERCFLAISREGWPELPPSTEVFDRILLRVISFSTARTGYGVVF